MTTNKYREYFGFKTEPFPEDTPPSKLLKLPDMVGVKERMDYILNLGSIMVVTGEVGSGKSTAVRWSLSQYHPSEVLPLFIIANGGSVCEFYKQLCWSLDIDKQCSSRALLLKTFKNTLKEIVTSKKQKVILIIDEANLLRPDVFHEMHTVTQFDADSKKYLSIVFTGQANLIDKFTYRTSQSLASRVLAKTHISAINSDQMEEYLLHHLKIAGIKKMLFSETAVNGIQQGSGGLLRKANFLAKGGLMAAAIDGQTTVNAEHIRIAATELL